MENKAFLNLAYLNFKKLLIISFIVSVFLLSPKYLFAYDDVVVHPNLTEEMAKLYNENFKDNQLTKDEIDSMRKGSTDEDKSVILAIRSSNHFYNPLGVKGWVDATSKKNVFPESALTSKQWAHASEEQEAFPGGDFSWETAIKNYAEGNEPRAYEALGHILHLIEDASVPAHVRSDLHVSPKELEAIQNWPVIKDATDYEPYESWTGKQATAGALDFSFAGKLSGEGKKPIIKSSLNDYFYNMATYTNAKFFSKDKIFAYYTKMTTVLLV